MYVEAGDMFHARGIEAATEVATRIGFETAPSIISPELVTALWVSTKQVHSTWIWEKEKVNYYLIIRK